MRNRRNHRAASKRSSSSRLRVASAVLEALEDRRLFSIYFAWGGFGPEFQGSNPPPSEMFTDLSPHKAAFYLATSNQTDGTLSGPVSGKSSDTKSNDDAWILGYHTDDSITIDFSQNVQWSDWGGLTFDWFLCDDDCFEFSEDPVRYADGAAKMIFDDFAGLTGTSLGGMQRSWSNLSYSGDQPGAKVAGFAIDSQPWIQQLYSNPLYGFELLAAISGSNQASVMLSWDGGAQSAESTRSSGFGSTLLRADAGTHTYRLIRPDGSELAIADYSNNWEAAQQGAIVMERGSGGLVSEVTSWTGSYLPEVVETTYPAAGANAAVVERMEYMYASDQITRATLSRGDGTTMAAIRTVDYDYYDGTTDEGSDGDLKSVTTRNGDEYAAVTNTEYYRWYKSGETNGYTGGLKFWLSGDAYRRATTELGSLGSASDEDLKPYADNYFEYDGSQRVTKEIAQGAGCSCVGNNGQGEYNFEYAATHGGTGRNEWAYKTIERLPDHTPLSSSDNNQNIVYTNSYGNPILKIFQDTAASQQYITYYRYNEQGQVVLQAEPSAVSGYDPDLDDLVGYNSSTDRATYLRDNSGLVNGATYFTEGTAPEAGLIGYLESTFLRLGDDASTDQTIQDYTYTDGGVADDGIYYVTLATAYAGADASQPRTTEFDYTWYLDGNSDPTTALKTRTTTWPAVLAAQNGPDSSTSSFVTQEIFDLSGQVVWTVDGDGYINYFERDPASGSVTTQIIDVDPTLVTDPIVAGPTRDGGLPTALGLTTLRAVDAFGRVTHEEDPNGIVAYTVYDDTTADSDPIETRVYAGWDDGSNQPTGPVHVSRRNPELGYSEELDFTYSDPSGLPVNGSGVPTGAESLTSSYVAVQSLRRQYVNVSGQVLTADAYFDLSGVTYSTSTSLGTAGTNFARTTYGYDASGRLNRVVSPTGTITRTVYNAIGFQTSVWVGTDDTPTSGYWSPTNTAETNLTNVTEYEYDSGAIGDGTLTAVIQHPGGGQSDRVTRHYYDWRDRLVASKSGIEAKQVDRLTPGGTIEVGDKFKIVVTDANGRSAELTVSATGTTVAQVCADITTAFNGSSDPCFTAITATNNTSYVILTADVAGLAFYCTVSTTESNGASTDGQTFARSSQTANGEGDSLHRLIYYTEYDNLDEPIVQELYAGDAVIVGDFDNDGTPDRPSSSILRAQTLTSYDDQGRVYETSVSSVDPSSGSVASDGLISDFVYDRRGNVIKTTEPGGLVRKYSYDSARRVSKSYASDGGEDSVWGDASNVDDDAVIEQTEYKYDLNGNVIFTINKQRFHDETGTDELGNPSTAPYARVYYIENYYDSLNRLTGTVDLGTNGGSALTSRPDGSLPSASDTKLRTKYAYQNNELQSVRISGSPTGGTFTLTFDGQTTSSIAYNASAATVQSALEALTTIGSDNVSVTKDATSGVYLVAFVEAFATQNVSQLTASSSLTGGSSPGVAVSTAINGSMGWLSRVTDPRDIASLTEHDLLGRTTKTIAAFVDGVPSNGDDQTTVYTYDGSGHVLTMTAVIPGGAVQTTQYVYGLVQTPSSITRSSSTATVTLTGHGFKVGQPITVEGASQSQYNGTFTITAVTSNTFTFTVSGSPASPATGSITVRPASDVVSNDILSAVRYPDKSSGTASSSEQETFTNNALGERKTFADRNGNVHTYTTDLLGRLTADAVTQLSSLGTISSGVRRRGFSFDSAGLPFQFTSYDAAVGGDVINDVERLYNGLGQVTVEYQEHVGAVDTGTSATVEYAYSEMASSTNHSRPTSMKYPDGRILRYEYADGLDDRISRLSYLADDNSSSVGTHLEEYSYLGLGAYVELNRPSEDVALTYIKDSGDTVSGDAGDQYKGLDRFGRVIDQRWVTSGGTDVDRFKYGYDRDSNVLYKQNTLSSSNSELYHANGAGGGYDLLSRIIDFRRGTLSDANSDGVPDTVSTASRTQGWTLDATGNWSSLNTNGTSVSRTHNSQNELTAVGATAMPFDNNGNMTTRDDGENMFYNAWNEVSEEDDQNTGFSHSYDYDYDALGRRLGYTMVDNRLDDMYYSLDWQVIQDESSNDGSPEHLVIDEYVWSAQYIDALVLRSQTPAGEATEVMWAHHDVSFNTTSIADDNGAIQERYVYDPYGDVTIKNASWTTRASPQISNYNWQYLFQGGRCDFITGNYLFRHRSYNALLGRWLQQDPAGFNDGANLYLANRGNPLAFSDPTGLQGYGAVPISRPLSPVEPAGGAGIVGIGLPAGSVGAGGGFMNPMGGFQYPGEPGFQMPIDWTQYPPPVSWPVPAPVSPPVSAPPTTMPVGAPPAKMPIAAPAPPLNPPHHKETAGDIIGGPFLRFPANALIKVEHYVIGGISWGGGMIGAATGEAAMFIFNDAWQGGRGGRKTMFCEVNEGIGKYFEHVNEEPWFYE